MERVMAMNDLIFGKYVKYSDVNTWNSKQNLYFEILEDIGFIAIYDRKSENENSNVSSHIWLCGVLPKHRRKGHFKTLIKKSMQRLSLNPIVTVCTFPNKFQSMHNWISNMGFQIIKKYNDGKVLFQIDFETFQLNFEKHKTQTQ